MRSRRGNLDPTRFVAVLLAMMGLAYPAHAGEPQHCVSAEIVLWGDGRHDDSEALNAWLGGADAIWAGSGGPVGAAISGRRFRLSQAIYVRGGTGRRLEEFRLDWPERGETVAGGVIESGSDVNAAPILSDVSIRGGDPGEGVPLESPDAPDVRRDDRASCTIS